MSDLTNKDAEARRVKQAIGWLMRLQQDDAPALRRQCEQWRREDAGHERAWQRVSGMHAELSQDLRTLPAGTVDTLENSAMRLRRRQALKLLSLTAVAGGSAWLAKDLSIVQPLLADQATAVGEHRHLALGHGDELDLNTDTAVDVRLDDRQRLIVLRQGELFVSCTANSQRPLRVSTPYGSFEAQAGAEPATRFGLRMRDGGINLHVEQGQVAVAGLPTFLATSGNRYRVADGRASAFERDDMDPSAWREGLIITRDMRLQDFLDEVGRYRNGHLGYTRSVADLRLSGVFRLGDTDELLRVMAQTLPIRVQYMTRWWVRVEAA